MHWLLHFLEFLAVMKCFFVLSFSETQPETSVLDYNAQRQPGGMNSQPGGMNMNTGGLNMQPSGMNMQTGGLNPQSGSKKNNKKQLSYAEGGFPLLDAYGSLNYQMDQPMPDEPIQPKRQKGKKGRKRKHPPR